MPRNKLLLFLRDISQINTILPFFPLTINTEWHVLGCCLEEWTHAALLFSQQPGNLNKKTWIDLAYRYQSDTKAKTSRNIKTACVKASHRSSKVCTAQNRNQASLPTWRWGSRHGRWPLTETCCKRLANIQFPSLHKPLPRGLPQQQDRQAEKVMLWGEGVPGLQPAWPGCSGSSTDISYRSCCSQTRRSSTCQEKQPAARGGVHRR